MSKEIIIDARWRKFIWRTMIFFYLLEYVKTNYEPKLYCEHLKHYALHMEVSAFYK